MFTFAFSIVRIDDPNLDNFRSVQLNWIKSQGFDVADYKEVDTANLEQTVKWFSEEITKLIFLPMGLCWLMMILNTGVPWVLLQNFQRTP